MKREEKKQLSSESPAAVAQNDDGKPLCQEPKARAERARRLRKIAREGDVDRLTARFKPKHPWRREGYFKGRE